MIHKFSTATIFDVELNYAMYKVHTSFHEYFSSSFRFAVRINQHVLCIAGDVHVPEESSQQDDTSAAGADSETCRKHKD